MCQQLFSGSESTTLFLVLFPAENGVVYYYRGQEFKSINQMVILCNACVDRICSLNDAEDTGRRGVYGRNCKDQAQYLPVALLQRDVRGEVPLEAYCLETNYSISDEPEQV